MGDRHRSQQRDREAGKQRALRLRPRADNVPPQPHSEVCRPVSEHVRRVAGGLGQRSRAESQMPELPVREEERRGSDRDRHERHRDARQHPAVRPQAASGDLEGDVKRHRRTEKQQVVSAGQVLREPRRRRARQRREPSGLEEAVEAEQHERHPHRRQDLDVRQRSEAVRRKSKGQTRQKRRAARSGQCAYEQEHPDRRQHERRQKGNVVREDRVPGDRVDGQNHHRLCGEMLRVRQGQGMRVVDVRLPVVAERLKLTAERAQQMVRVPRQNPGVEQWIAEVGREIARQPACQRPGQDDCQQRVRNGRDQCAAYVLPVPKPAHGSSIRR